MNIYITLDYELYLGSKTGSIENCLIRPMDALMDFLDTYRIRVTVFADAAYLLRIRELMHESEELKQQFNRIAEHITSIHNKGHDVQLHFHPQWLYSEYKNGGWIMDFAHYSLSGMDNDVAFTQFNKAKTLLENIVNKKITAFRAGGFALTDFPNYTELFRKNGIKIDSSAIRNVVCKTAYKTFDYRNIPEKSIYNFQQDLFTEDDAESSDSIKEMPVTTKARNNLLYSIMVRYYSKKHRAQKWGDGKGMSDFGSTGSKIIQKLANIKITVPASIDGVSSFLLPSVYSALKKKNTDNMIIIGHPKAITNATMTGLKSFIESHGDLTFKTVSGQP